ncbi:hypothetical protein BC832DRAFT_217410 [Gaertneriomyces semiglobifer]|nr:hypothetical protein BC832DRAFT_217410 [Gaertneriomyces semiglobifer]
MCHDVSKVIDATSVDHIQQLVKEYSQQGIPIRATGSSHSWYDTGCTDDPRTVVIRTEAVNRIVDFNLEQGYVTFEAGATFFQVADYLHQRGASLGYALVNWNMTIAGAAATGSHRMSLKNPTTVGQGIISQDIVDGTGTLRTVDASSGDDFKASTTSLGLLGIVVRVKFKIYPDTKLWANQKTLDEKEVLNGDIYKMIAPYEMANFWWFPLNKKMIYRTYELVPNDTPGDAFQSTFSSTLLTAAAGKLLLEPASNLLNMAFESIAFKRWESPNFRNKTTNQDMKAFPVIGWNYDVLIGGLYPGEKPLWEYGLDGYTFEVAVPMTQSNRLLQRIRQLMDDEARKLRPFAATYVSGINIKFASPTDDFLSQATVPGNSPGEDWSKGAIMFDMASFRPRYFDRYNEPFYKRLYEVIMSEFTARPHYTKCHREVYKLGKPHLNQEYVKRFVQVKKKFDPNHIFDSVLGELLGLQDY